MSIKGTHTTADYLDFDITLNKSLKLLKSADKNFKVAFLTVVGLNTGLRISDLLTLKHQDLKSDKIIINEKKTGKYREIKINDTIKDAHNIYMGLLGQVDEIDPLFISQKKTVFTSRQINNILKSMFGGKNKNISSHSIRKGFGRKVWELDSNSDRALILLSKLFNHTSTQVTRTYLSIQQEELDNVYLSL